VNPRRLKLPDKLLARQAQPHWRSGAGHVTTVHAFGHHRYGIVRMQALEVLARKSAEPSVKGVLIHALLNDGSLGVRLKALEGLKPFAGEVDVRTAFMQALMSDPNDGVRVGVVDALAPFTNSEADANRIEEVTRHDDNTYVRLKGQGLIQLVGTHK